MNKTNGLFTAYCSFGIDFFAVVLPEQVCNIIYILKI